MFSLFINQKNHLWKYEFIYITLLGFKSRLYNSLRQPVTELTHDPIQGSFLWYNIFSYKTLMPLRPHQTDAVTAMWNNDKGQVIVPTGGGKTM